MKPTHEMNLAEVTMAILKTAVNIPDGLYVHAARLARKELAKDNQPESNRWIDCNLKLPAESESVLCAGHTDDGERRTFRGYRKPSGTWFEYNNGDYIDGGYGDDYKATVTHWQPIPEPPAV